MLICFFLFLSTTARLLSLKNKKKPLGEFVRQEGYLVEQKIIFIFSFNLVFFCFLIWYFFLLYKKNKLIFFDREDSWYVCTIRGVNNREENYSSFSYCPLLHCSARHFSCRGVDNLF